MMIEYLNKKEAVLYTDFSNSVRTVDVKAQYDAGAKRLIGQKDILAYILVNTVDVFKGMSPKEAVNYIEGTPYISTVPVEPGVTNTSLTKNGKRIVGINTESAEVNEGMVRYDIVFYAKVPLTSTTDSERKHLQIIINVEAQKDEPAGYGILNRAVFYVSRLISSQKERDFVNSEYDDIKQVYSIWICMNMKENSISHIHLTKEDLVGSCKWNGRLDLFNIIMIGLAGTLPEHNEMYELHHLLGTLLSSELTADEKLSIMEHEYDISVEEKFRRDVNIMCNLSEGIEEKGMAKGIAKGEAQIIINMHNNGLTAAQISKLTDKNEEYVKEIIACEEK